MRISGILATVFILAIHTAFADPVVDSLLNVLKTAEGDKKVKTLNELFRAHVNADPVKAIGFTREALVLATEINDKKGMAASYNNLGVAYKGQGALDKALEYYLVSLKLYTELENKDGIATTKNNIGSIYSIKKDFGQAMKYFEESQKLFTELKDPNKVVGSMNNLGNLHSELQLFEQALKFYSEAWQMSEKNGKPFIDPLSNIGNLYYRQGNYQRAVEYYTRALDLARKDNSMVDVLNITANLGEVYVKAGRAREAQPYLDSALVLCKKMQATIFEPQILKSMAANYARQNKMKEAYETMLAYDKIKEKIYGEESSRKIAQMEMALDLHEKEKEVDFLRKDDEMKSLALKNTRMVIVSVILGIGALIAALNLLLVKRRSFAK